MSDFLSLCPCLIDILSFVNYRDLPNCYLINRRIHDVIERNPASHPERKAFSFITITPSLLFPDKFSFTVDLYVECGQTSTIEITHARVREDQRNSRISEYYRVNGAEWRTNLLHLLVVNRDLNNVEMHLATLMSVIFEYYSVEQIEIKDSQWVRQAVSESLLVVPNAKASNLVVGCAWPGLSALSRHLGSRRISVDQGSRPLAEPLWHLPYQQELFVYLTLEIASIELITDLIMKWQQDINRLRLLDISGKGGCSVFANWSSFEMVEALEGILENYELKQCDNNRLLMYFRRKGDQISLVLAFSSREQRLRITDNNLYY